jgi:hypothetical protein
MPKLPELKPSTPEQVAAWLTTLEGKSTRLDLRRPGAAKRVQLFTKAANSDADDLAKKILTAAEIDGQSRMIPIVIYELSATGTSSDQDGDATLTLRVRGAGNESGDDFDQPDLGTFAVKQQQMIIQLIGLVLKERSMGQDYLFRQMDHMSARLTADDAKKVEFFRLMEDLTNTKMQREVEMNNSKLLEKRQDMLAEQIRDYLPIAMSRFLGGGPGTGKAPMSEQMVERLVQGLTEEQLEAIAGTLSEGQQTIFYELYTSLAAKRGIKAKRTIAVEVTKTETNGVAVVDGKADPS